MKKRFYIIGVLSVALVCLITLYSGISLAGVVGSKHDMSSGFWATGQSQFTYETSQVCVFCHTPHGTDSNARTTTYITTGPNPGAYTVGGTPLLGWNRAFANGAAGGSNPGYRGYDSATMNANVSQVRIYTLMCMGCHDGVSAMNVMQNPPDAAESWETNTGGYPTPEGDNLMSAAVGSTPHIGERDDITDPVQLSNDHPISIDYDSNLVSQDSGLRPPSADGTVTSGSVKLRLFVNPSGNLVSMECSTCHDPHNYGSDAAGTAPFLATSNKNSALCIVCHLK